MVDALDRKTQGEVYYLPSSVNFRLGTLLNLLLDLFLVSKHVTYLRESS